MHLNSHITDTLFMDDGNSFGRFPNHLFSLTFYDDNYINGLHKVLCRDRKGKKTKK